MLHKNVIKLSDELVKKVIEWSCAVLRSGSEEKKHQVIGIVLELIETTQTEHSILFPGLNFYFS